MNAKKLKALTDLVARYLAGDGSIEKDIVQRLHYPQYVHIDGVNYEVSRKKGKLKIKRLRSSPLDEYEAFLGEDEPLYDLATDGFDYWEDYWERNDD
jgi:hypothetical protein